MFLTRDSYSYRQMQNEDIEPTPVGALAQGLNYCVASGVFFDTEYVVLGCKIADLIRNFAVIQFSNRLFMFDGSLI